MPIDRGILETIYFRRTGGKSRADLLAIYEEPLRRRAVRPALCAGSSARICDAVASTNFCDIGFLFDPDTDARVVVADDNLVKGAAGQAVQNMNLAARLPETESLL